MKNHQILYLALSLSLGLFLQSCSEKGCTDTTACNFDSVATQDDGSCSYAPEWYEDIDQDGLGNASSIITSCSQPDGYVSDSSDEFDAVISSRQRATIFYIGATWCAPCGSGGDPIRNAAYSSYKEGPSNDVVLISLQRNDNISDASEISYDMGFELNSFMNQNSIPQLYWVAENSLMERQTVYVQDWANEQRLEELYGLVVNDNASVGVAAVSSMNDSEVNVDVVLNFYESKSVEHYVSYYLLEDSVFSNQDINEFPFTTFSSHANVLRASKFSTNIFGTSPIGNSFTSNQTVELSETITIPNNVEKTEMLSVAVIIWDGTTPNDVVNSFVSKVH